MPPDDMSGPTERPTLIVALPPEEQEPVVEELLDAGFNILEARSPADLVRHSTSGPPFALALVDASLAPRLMVDTIAEMRRNGREFTTLYVTPFEAFDAVEGAGVDASDELVARPFTPDSLRWRVEAMVIRSGSEADAAELDGAMAGPALRELAGDCPIFAVFNPKGGVGKTTISTNLASTLQLRKGRQVLLVDADTVTGHVALSLGIKKFRGIADSWGTEHDGDAREPILNMTTVHSSGIRVATLTADPLTVADLDGHRVVDAILEARSGVDAIIIDLHPSYTDMNLAIFAIATRILVPVTPDLPAIRAAVQLVKVAEQLGVRDRLSLVVNRANSGVSVADIEKTVGLKAMSGIRSSGVLLVRAGNHGRTLVEAFPRENITADFDRLADRVLEVAGQTAVSTAPAPERSRVRGFLGVAAASIR
jgi:pilus assembly protein CpaE